MPGRAVLEAMGPQRPYELQYYRHLPPLCPRFRLTFRGSDSSLAGSQGHPLTPMEGALFVRRKPSEPHGGFRSPSTTGRPCATAELL